MHEYHSFISSRDICLPATTLSHSSCHLISKYCIPDTLSIYTYIYIFILQEVFVIMTMKRKLGHHKEDAAASSAENNKQKNKNKNNKNNKMMMLMDNSKRSENDNDHLGDPHTTPDTTATTLTTFSSSTARPQQPNQPPHHTKKKKENILPPLLKFDYQYIVAPMVGASELPFRLLCRKYGAQLCYTPMMMANEFATSAKYRQAEFPISVLDRPLVCHFAANTPHDFAAAAQLAAPHCDAIDLNLGCPQRTAYVGHFGSYLLDPKERSLIVDIVRAGVAAVDIPIFVKIRLLDTYEETRQLVKELFEDAGATLIAVHARYRASFDRKGPGARDGPAMLDQVKRLRLDFPPDRILLITNGNTITYDDVVQNLQETQADGLMSAEGILDNPALFLPRFFGGKEDDTTSSTTMVPVQGGDPAFWKQREQEGKKWFKKLKKIQKIEQKQQKGKLPSLTPKQEKKLAKKSKVIAALAQLDETIVAAAAAAAAAANTNTNSRANTSSKSNKSDTSNPLTTACVPLKQLYETAQDKTLLALEYLQWAYHYPTTMRTIIFHTRRMLKVELTTYQLMDECLACQTLDQVQAIIHKIRGYQADPATFHFDKLKARQDKEAMERKKQEEGKRKNYEARMIRKAKREGKKDDLEFYLRQGAVVPTAETVKELLTLSQPEQMQLWKDRDHSQHCIGFHLNGGVCQRGRSCAFLHVHSTTANTFEESDEVAG